MGRTTGDGYLLAGVSSNLGGNENAKASTALTTFVEPPSHRSDGPSSPRPNSSVASPVAHQNKSGVINSCRTSNAVAGISEKYSSVAWGTGRESELLLSGNAGMAIAVLSPGGIFKNKNKKNIARKLEVCHWIFCIEYDTVERLEKRSE